MACTGEPERVPTLEDLWHRLNSHLNGLDKLEAEKRRAMLGRLLDVLDGGAWLLAVAYPYRGHVRLDTTKTNGFSRLDANQACKMLRDYEREDANWEALVR